MELDVGILLHGHLQGIWRFRQEDITAFLVFSKVDGLTHLEIRELGFIFAGNPSGLVK